MTEYLHTESHLDIWMSPVHVSCFSAIRQYIGLHF